MVLAASGQTTTAKLRANQRRMPPPTAEQLAQWVQPSSNLLRQGTNLVVVQSEHTFILKLPAKLGTGVRMEADGTFTRLDGTRGTLQDGERMTATGILLPPPIGAGAAPVASGGESQSTRKEAGPAKSTVRPESDAKAK